MRSQILHYQIRRPTRRSRLLPGAALLCLTALAAGSATAAEDVIYGPDGAPTVVQRKLYTMSNRWEVGLHGTASLNTALVDQYGGLLTVSYHPNEWAEFGVDAFGNYTAFSSLVDGGTQSIRPQLPPRADANSGLANKGDEFSNASQLRFGALAMGRIAPVYGKLDLASELKVHLQAYLLLGIGGALVHNESINLCASAGKTPCPSGGFQVTDSFKPLGEFGGGMRFFLGGDARGGSWSLLAEVRAFLFPADLKTAVDLTNPASGTATTYLGLVTDISVGLARTF